MASYRYEIIGRYMNGPSVEAYALRDTKTQKSVRVTREQAAFLVGRQQIRGVTGRLYQDQLIIEAQDGFTKLADLPKYDVNKGEVRFKSENMQGTKRKPLNFDSVVLRGKYAGGGFVVEDGSGAHIIDREQLLVLLNQKRVINASLQVFNNPAGKTQRIIRMSDRSRLSDLPEFSDAQVASM